MEDLAFYGVTEEMAVRKQTLQPARCWESPTPEEVREIIRLAGMTHDEVSTLVGVSTQNKKTGRGSRTVRRWVSGESLIPYAVWAILAYKAGFGIIWE